MKLIEWYKRKIGMHPCRYCGKYCYPTLAAGSCCSITCWATDVFNPDWRKRPQNLYEAYETEKKNKKNKINKK